MNVSNVFIIKGLPSSHGKLHFLKKTYKMLVIVFVCLLFVFVFARPSFFKEAIFNIV